MQESQETTSEDLVRAMRQAHLNDDQASFTALASTLFQRCRTYIARKVAQKLEPGNLMHLAQDAAAEIYRHILEDARMSTPKRGMETVFNLYLNETCRDTLETFLRQEGIPVPTRHKARNKTVPQRPDRVPVESRVSLNAPVNDDNDTLLEETVSDDQVSIEAFVMDRIERVDRLQTLTPEQRMLVVVYGDYVDRQLKADEIAARRGIPITEVKRFYNEACKILRMAKEHHDA